MSTTSALHARRLCRRRPGGRGRAHPAHRDGGKPAPRLRSVRPLRRGRDRRTSRPSYLRSSLVKSSTEITRPSIGRIWVTENSCHSCLLLAHPSSSTVTPKPASSQYRALASTTMFVDTPHRTTSRTPRCSNQVRRPELKNGLTPCLVNTSSSGRGATISGNSHPQVPRIAPLTQTLLHHRLTMILVNLVFARLVYRWDRACESMRAGDGASLRFGRISARRMICCRRFPE